MLREQDDPTSKIGKANDDSVLFPKRASRLNLFYRNDLTDIAEVASLNGSIRPAFASTKAHSYGSSDGYGTDDGQMMNRPRPGEGNNLFGGRQKIYRIAVGARTSSGDANGNEDGNWTGGKGMGGRALYGDDVASSAFARPAQSENPDSPVLSSEPHSVRSSQAPQRSDSPLFTYNHKRETTSSTTSVQVESRASTAATSVASQRSANGASGNPTGSPQPSRASASVMANPPSMDRQAAKARRLYGQGLDQHIYDQQSSAMHRLESLQRQRALGASSLPRNLSQSQSGHNLQERYQRSAASNIPGSHRAASPPASGSPSRLREFDLGLPTGPSSATSQPETGYFRSPPLSPPMSPVPDPKLVAALEPNDVGKATALGAFNKPSKQFDEQQYLERQIIQLQQRRESPPITQPLTPMAQAPDQPKRDQPRSHSPVSPLSRSNSLDTSQPSDPAMRIVSEIYHGDRKEIPSIDETQSDVRETFLSAETPSDIGSPLIDTRPGHPSNHQASSKIQKPAKWIFETPKPEKPRDIDHPIHRLQQQQYHHTHLPYPSEEKGVERPSEITASQTLERNMSIDQVKRTKLNPDSPTLGPANEVTGLNGLVHTHLRNDSGQSSIYPEPSPPLESKFPDDFRRENPSINHDPEVRSSETFFRKSTWEDVGVHGKQPATGAARSSPGAVPPPLSLRARRVLEQAAALQNHNSPKVQQMLGLDNTDRGVGHGASRRIQDAGNVPSWQEHLKTHHTRGGSTETEKERESFANELAERRRMVQDNLKSFVENESRSRSNSPMPVNRTLEHSPSKQGTSFGILRSKTSKGALAAKPEHSSKAMKMLGISVGSGASNIGGNPQIRQENSLEQEAEHGANRSSYDLRIPAYHPRPGLQDSRQHSNPVFAQRRIELQQINERRQESLNRRSPPQTKTSSREDRSNSDSSDRDGRSGRLANTTTRDRENQIERHSDGVQARPYGNFSRPSAADQIHTAINSSLDERSHPALSSRFRSNSNQANGPGVGFVESRGNLPRYPSSAHTSSPGSAHSSLSTPSYEPSPNTQNTTTPFMMAPSSYSNAATRLPSHRKRSINKHDISDPTFVSSTSSISTVDLPPGASLSNGMDSVYAGSSLNAGGPPPIPPINPRRRRTQTLRQALGRLNDPETGSRTSPNSQTDLTDDRSTFSVDEDESRVRYRTRLRKTSSEGGNMNYRARQQMMMVPSPAMPSFPQSHSAGPSPAMSNFPHSMQASGTGTGVMF